jgi:TPR repeat protein
MMPTEFDAKDHADCAAAERLIDRATRTSDDATRDELMDQAYRLPAPLVARQLPAAQYLYACCFLSRECERAEEVEPRYIELVQAAAQAGDPRAQFRLAQMLDRGGELEHDAERSARLFQNLAERAIPTRSGFTASICCPATG